MNAGASSLRPGQREFKVYSSEGEYVAACSRQAVDSQNQRGKEEHNHHHQHGNAKEGWANVFTNYS